MIDEKVLSRVKKNNFTLKHKSQKEIDKISNINFILFLFWLDEKNIILKDGYFRYSKDTNLTIYGDIAYNHYIGTSYKPLLFLQAYENYDYRQSLYILNHYYYKIHKATVKKEFKSYMGTDVFYSPDENTKANLQYILDNNLLSSPNDDLRKNAYTRVYSYLVSRGFERWTIQNIINHKWLIVDENYNLCFITYEDDNKTRVSAITKRGTTAKVFKCNYTAERNIGFFYAPQNTTNPTMLFVFESCLDLFSFIQLYWKKRISIDNSFCCISLNGANNQKYIYKILSKYPIENICLCLDNDTAGIQATKNITRQMITPTHDLTPLLKEATKLNNYSLIKDWNDVLKIEDKIIIDIEQFIGIKDK